jgi:aspartyl-tRNA(Asn)/glutamyl-tRNA(Gln) amidotransferase subunit B
LTLPAPALADIVALVDSNKVSFAMVNQKILPEVIKSNGTKKALAIAEELNLIQTSDSSAIEPIVDEVLAKFPDKVKEYKGGKTGVLQMFMGEVMKATKGKADPKVTTEIIKKKLDQ